MVGDQCQYGQEDAVGNPLRKPTGWMSSSRHVLEALRHRCQGTGGHCTRRGGGRHGSTTGKTAREAAVYPFKLCKALLVGLHKQLKAEGKLTDGVVGVQGLFEASPLDGQLTSYVDVHTGEQVQCLEYPKLEELFAVNKGQPV